MKFSIFGTFKTLHVYRVADGDSYCNDYKTYVSKHIYFQESLFHFHVKQLKLYENSSFITRIILNLSKNISRGKISVKMALD